MSVWFAIPSKKPAAEAQRCVDEWRTAGYRVAIWRDEGEELVDCDLLMTGQYTGYANAVNALCAEILKSRPYVEWIVTGGDDTSPASKPPAEIAAECTAHFGGTFGVMQPTGDGHGIERICGSPWLGADWCRRAHGGRGPLWHEYTHMFVDSDLQGVAKKLGALWQRPDLRHRHHHWTFEGKPQPDYMREQNSRAHWDKYLKLYESRARAGFPGCDPCGA